jgi:hypothetical protein
MLLGKHIASLTIRHPFPCAEGAGISVILELGASAADASDSILPNGRVLNKRHPILRQ